MGFRKSIKTFAANPKALQLSKDAYTSYIKFSKEVGNDYTKTASMVFDGEETLQNYKDNVIFLSDYIDIVDKKDNNSSKTSHNLSLINVDNVKELVKTYTSYNLKVVSVAGKPRLSLFTLDPELVKSYLAYLVETGVFNPTKDYSKAELSRIQTQIIKAEYDTEFKAKYNSTNEYLLETYPEEMKLFNYGTEAMDELNVFVNTGNINDLISSHVEVDNSDTYIMSGDLIIAKPRVDTNISLLAGYDVDQEKAAIVALYKDSTIPGGQIESILNNSFDQERKIA